MKVSRKARLKVLRDLEQKAAAEAADWMRRLQAFRAAGDEVNVGRAEGAVRSKIATDCWLIREIAEAKK